MIGRRRSTTLSLGRGLVVAALTSFFMAAGLTAAEARKLALVVGNSDYATVPKLKNAAKDATDIAAALERLGFEVTLLTDVKGPEFWTRVDAFSAEAETAEASIFYYAGHAFQMQGTNYLVPVDAALTSREALRTQTWNLDGIISRLQDRRRQTLIFLDACRNDPVPASVRGSGAADGLARVQTGVGTFVAFATEPGGVTFDGAGEAPNSPFTTALLKNIETPGLSISDMMIKVRNDVAEATGGKQSPWDQSSLREQFYFQAATEAKQELTEADYELLAQLPEADRKQFLELLAASGFSEESLQAADDAITVASYNLEVAAESEVTLGAAPPEGVATPTETGPEVDVASLEVVEDGQEVGSAVTEAGTATETATVEPTTEPTATEVATAEPTTEPTTTEVATADPATEVATAEPTTEPTTTEVATVEPTTEPTATEVATVEPTTEPTTTEVATVEPTTEPTATEVATAEPTTEPTATEVATAEPTTELTTTEVATAEPTTEPTTTEVATAEPTTEPTTTEVASIPATTVTGDLPQPEGGTRLGAKADEPEPIRLAALTWQTRGIVELNAVDTSRSVLTASEVTPDNDTNREILAAIDPSLLGELPAAVEEGDLARTIQAELARLGCYRMKVDGSWGKGSRTALTSYFLAKRMVPTSLEPTAELVAQLQGEAQVVCAVQVARAKIVPGKTKAILPVKAAASEGTPTKRKAKAGRVAKTREETKKGISKSLLGSGSF